MQEAEAEVEAVEEVEEEEIGAMDYEALTNLMKRKCLQSQSKPLRIISPLQFCRSISLTLFISLLLLSHTIEGRKTNGKSSSPFAVVITLYNLLIHLHQQLKSKSESFFDNLFVMDDNSKRVRLSQSH